MNPWLDNVVPDWRLTELPEPSEDERAYLLNDIGLLCYVFKAIAPEPCIEPYIEVPDGISSDA